MNSPELAQKRLVEIISRCNKPSVLRKVLFSFFLLVFLFAIYAFITQLVKGQIVTGMRDYVVWGIYDVNFIFFIGISYAGAMISGILHLLHVEWRKPIIRIAEMITVISVIIGPVFILVEMGRLDRIFNIFTHGRIQSPILWDVVAITTYLSCSILFLYLALIKDYALFRDNTELKIPKWQRYFYRKFAATYSGLPEQKKLLERALTIMSAIIIPLAVLVHSVLAWIFGMTIRPGWHSTIFAPYFVIAAVYSGTAVLIIAMWIFRKFYHLEEYITEKHFKYIGTILLVLAALYGYFTFSEYLTVWYGSQSWELEVIYKLFDFTDYGAWFYLAAFIGVLVPMLFVGLPFLRNINTIMIGSVVAVVCMWIKRYLIIIPTLETPLLPLQDVRPEYVHYSATWVEWSLTAGGMATFCLFFMIFMKFMPIIPIADISEAPENKEFISEKL
ncbi:MAG: polysulfide reductase NrfD [Bacteroidetes bacterium]|nr:polysulfide reductase NrfD [Bacteroidota bacterium]